MYGAEGEPISWGYCCSFSFSGKSDVLNIGSANLSIQYRFCPQCSKDLVEGKEGTERRLKCPDSSCGFVYYDNPTPVLAAIVEHDEQIVLARNVGWPESWYGLVTGFLEKHESPEHGVLREVKEELNLDGEIINMVGVYAFEKRNQLILAYHIKASGEIELNEELAAIKHIKPAELKPWPFGTGLAVRDWLVNSGYNTNV